MAVTLLVTVAWLAHAALAVRLLVGRHPEAGPSGEITGLGAITAGTVLILAVLLAPWSPVTHYATATGLVALNLATALALRWRAFRADEFAISPGWDFALVASTAVFWAAALLQLAFHLHPHRPFAALLIGILGFFLPVNALAEVYAAVSTGRRTFSPTTATKHRGP